MPHNSEAYHHVDNLRERLNVENKYLLDEFLFYRLTPTLAIF